MVVSSESLFLAWYSPQPGSNSNDSEASVDCTFPCFAILIRPQTRVRHQMPVNSSEEKPTLPVLEYDELGA
jgi:hypothetical protein